MKVKKYYDPVFHADILFVNDCDAYAFDAYLEKKYKLPSDEFNKSKDGVVFKLENKRKSYTEIIYVIWVRKKDGFYTLMHECVHLVQKIFSDRGVPFNENNEELIAYYQEHWFKQMWRFMNKKVKKK